MIKDYVIFVGREATVEQVVVIPEHVAVVYTTPTGSVTLEMVSGTRFSVGGTLQEVVEKLTTRPTGEQNEEAQQRPTATASGQGAQFRAHQAAGKETEGGERGSPPAAE